MSRILDLAMWFMFLISFIFTILTMLVLFGKFYIGQFTTFLPLEISLSITFLLWGINSHFNPYTKNSKNSFLYSLILGSILVGFAVMGIY
ncbi:MAG: hypothetical protein K0R09_1266 [Clostridiales bacterium]|nr:hypothetical protein [Clostridiales bacterium]